MMAVRIMAVVAGACMFASFTAVGADCGFPGEKTNFNGAALYLVTITNGFVARVLSPEKSLPGKPWVLASSLYNIESKPVANMTRTQLELVKRGFHVVGAAPGVVLGAPDPSGRWEAVYKAMTGTYGLSAKVVLMGLSREGLQIARWAAANPGKVSCLYMDKAVCDFKSWPGGKLGIGKGSPKDWAQVLKYYNFQSEEEALAYKENPVDLSPRLVADKVAIIYLTGILDNVVPLSENGARMQEQYEKLGGVFKLIRRESEGHHPHGMAEPAPVVDFIQSQVTGR